MGYYRYTSRRGSFQTNRAVFRPSTQLTCSPTAPHDRAATSALDTLWKKVRVAFLREGGVVTLMESVSRGGGVSQDWPAAGGIFFLVLAYQNERFLT